MRNSCSIVWSVARTTRPIAAREATPPSSSDGSTPRSIGPRRAVDPTTSISDMDSLPGSSGQETVHGYPRGAPGDEVRGDSGRAMGHRPADMTVSGVEKKVVKAPTSEKREIVWGHRSQSGPHLGALVVGPVGIEFLDDALHER